MENKEIERKWLLKGIPSNIEIANSGVRYQYYLSENPEVRVVMDNFNGSVTYSITIKSGKKGLSRTEINIPITKEQYESIVTIDPSVQFPSVVKIYYKLKDGAVVSYASNPITGEGFVYAEQEYENEVEAENTAIPNSITGLIEKEITGIPEYYMYSLATRKNSSVFKFVNQ